MSSVRAADSSAAAAGSARQTSALASASGAQAAATPAGCSDDAVLPVLDAVSDYEKIKRIGEGTFGIVCEWVGPAMAGRGGWQGMAGRRARPAGESVTFAHRLQLSPACLSWPAVPCSAADKARDKRTGELVALKKLRMERERDGGSCSDAASQC